MKQAALKTERRVRLKASILFFAFASLIFTLLGCLNAMINLENISSGIGFHAGFSIGSIGDFFWIFKRLFPCVLLIVYVLTLYRKTRFPVVAVIFGWVAIKTFVSILRSLPIILEGYMSAVFLLTDVPVFVTFSLAAVQALHGMKKKGFMITAIATVLIITVASDLYKYVFMVSTESLFGATLLQMLLDWLCGLLETVLFYVALLLFCLNNTLPSVFRSSAKRKKAQR